MLLMCQPIIDAIHAVRTENSLVIMLTPQGETFQQTKAAQLAQADHLIFLCGHYEGFDERIRDYVDVQMSLGDFVLTGGEPACAVMCDAIIRLLPGVIRQDSSDDDSFSNGLLEYPQYTKPYEYDGKKVPDVLLSGHHENIRKWRREQAVIKTASYRPDLLKKVKLTEQEQKLVREILKTK